uniref:Putative secreted protein n=1 Tax=Anopheles darlingi TaxID=43151 RepID=A0A2M4DG57_ANODA
MGVSFLLLFLLVLLLFRIIVLVVASLVAHLTLERQLCLPLDLADVIHRETEPLVLPGPGLPVCTHHRLA